ncbi:MAG: hypothetical protein Q8O28_10250 [Smithellaceae bacterium]|nr:hypothetical protein [Smithellaceae bacterium]
MMKCVIWNGWRFCLGSAGGGFGEALVKQVLSTARLLDAHRVEIGIIDDHQELRDWYEKLGFEEVESKKFPQLVFRVTFMAYYF